MSIVALLGKQWHQNTVCLINEYFTWFEKQKLKETYQWLILVIRFVLINTLTICVQYPYLEMIQLTSVVNYNNMVIIFFCLILVFFIATMQIYCRSRYEVHAISFQTFFIWALLLIVHTWNSSPFEVISSGCNALVPFQKILEDSMEVLLCDCVSAFRHSLHHLFNCLITTVSELRE